MEDREKAAFEHYIAIGAIELEGIDENGEFLYRITDNAEKIAPDLWHIHMEMVNETISELIQKDLVSVEYDENLSAKFNVSEEGFKYLKDAGYNI